MLHSLKAYKYCMCNILHVLIFSVLYYCVLGTTVLDAVVYNVVPCQLRIVPSYL